MRDVRIDRRRRRVALGAILLFCFSFGWSQVRIERSIFRSGREGLQDPSALLRSHYRVGVPGNLQAASHLALMSRSLSVSGAPDTQQVIIDSLGSRSESMMVDTQSTRKSPTLAMLMSMVVPGSGQIYVHRYITIPIIWGFGYYFVKAWSDQNKQYTRYRDLFAASVQADSLHNGDANLQSYRDFYRDDRDKFAFYIAITYILNIVDAYVGASLYSFDVSDNLGGSAAIRLRIPIR